MSEWWFNAVSAAGAIFTARTCYHAGVCRSTTAAILESYSIGVGGHKGGLIGVPPPPCLYT